MSNMDFTHSIIQDEAELKIEENDVTEERCVAINKKQKRDEVELRFPNELDFPRQGQKVVPV